MTDTYDEPRWQCRDCHAVFHTWKALYHHRDECGDCR